MTIFGSRPRWKVLAAVAFGCSAILAPAVAQAASASHARPAAPASPAGDEANAETLKAG